MRTIESAALRFRTDLELAFVPPRERLADKLADAVIAIDDARFIAGADDAGDLCTLGRSLHAVWDEINEMMKRISD